MNELDHDTLIFTHAAKSTSPEQTVPSSSGTAS